MGWERAANVRFGSKADIGEGATDVRFTPKSGHSVEQLAGLRIEISVADAAVDGAMAKADIREIAGTVQADRNVAGQINHVIVGAGGCAGIDWSRSWSGLYYALARGYDDFAAFPSYAIFLCVIYPLLGILLIGIASGNSLWLLPLVVRIAAGFALVGPIAAIGLYELSWRREGRTR